MGKEDESSVKKIGENQTVKIAVILILAAAIGLGFFLYRANYAVASTIWLDGSSGIEIKVNQKEKVLEVNAKEDVARKIIGDTDFRGSNLDVTIEALIGSMMRNGYLSGSENPITIHVESKDLNKGQKLQKELTEEINELLQIDLFRDSMLSQTELTEEEGKQLADHYGITMEKIQMIQEIRKQDSSYSFEDLAARSLQELQLLRDQKAAQPNSIIESDLGDGILAIDDKTYIDKEQAKSIALTHAGVTADTAFLEKCELDYENGIMVYEIEFQSGGYEYDYDINAATGEVVGHKKEADNHHAAHGNQSSGTGNHNIDSGSNTGTNIGEEQAKTAAYSHAGVSADQVILEKCTQDYEDGIIVYEIEFRSGGYEYEYDIHAVTGEVLSFKKEADNHSAATASNQSNGAAGSGIGASTYISESEARETAISRAGLSGVSGLIVEIELENEDGIMVYEVEIKSGGYEHKCEINAVTGVILSYEKERDD